MIGRVLRKKHDSITTLKKEVEEEIKNISKQYELTDTQSIVDAIMYPIKRYGVDVRDSDYFNANNINNILTASSQNIQLIDPTETSTEQLTDAPQIRSRMEASKVFVDKSFGLAREASIEFQNTINQSLFDCLFINRGSINKKVGLVQTNKQLNDNIRNYHEYLLKNIISYLKDVKKDAKSLKIDDEIKKALRKSVMYDENNKYTGILEILQPLIDTYIVEPNLGKTDIIREMYNTSKDSSNPNYMASKRKLSAFNSVILLRNFDTYLSYLLGKAIKIKDFNQKTGENKYQISEKTANLATTWRVSENIFVEDEADAVTKLAINTSKLYDWGSDVPKEGYFLKFSDLQHIIGKIKDLTFNPKLDEIKFDKTFKKNYKKLYDSLQPELRGKTLRTLITSIRRNPKRYVHTLFNILSDETFKEDNYKLYHKFTQDELNKLYSLSKEIFNGSTSLRSLTMGNADVNYYAFITQQVDSIFNVKYIQYYKNEEGKIQVRTLLDQGINNIKRKIEKTINSSNSINLIGNITNYRNSLKLRVIKSDEGALEYVTFTIPNTEIRARVSVSSGDVQIKMPKDYQIKFDDVIPFIDNILRLNIQNNREFLNILINQFGSKEQLQSNLLNFACRVVMNRYVSKTEIDPVELNERVNKIEEIFGKNAPGYNWELDELSMIHGNDVNTLNNIALAKANLEGITTATQVKDSEGNGQSNQTLSRLLGSLQSQWELQEKNEDSVSNSLQLLTNPEILEGIYTTKEYYDPSDRSKEATKMIVREMAYSQILYDYIGGLVERKDANVVGNGHVLILPSVNSDKGTIGRLRINLNAIVNLNGVEKPLKNFTTSEMQMLISQEFGNFYEKMYKKITYDWQKLEDFIVSKGINVKGLLANGFIDGFQEFNEKFPLLTNKYSNPVDFIKSMVLEYNKTNRLHPLELVDQVHYKNNKGNLAINKSIIAQIARFKPESYIFQNNAKYLEYPTAEQFWNKKKAEVIKSLLKSDFKINTTDSSQIEIKYIQEHYPEWINKSGNFILAKANINGTLVNISSKLDFIKLGIKNINDIIDTLDLKINPILENYNYLDYLASQEFMNLTVGSFVAHPEKSKSNDVLEQEAAHFQAQHKRNVSFTAAMQEFQLNLLNGIPESYNIAVIEDIHDTQGTIIGLNNDIKPFDGATFVNPFVVLLENYSLGGNKAGISKKQFVHFKNESTGTGGIIKTAGFGLTNDWIRNSPFLETMMKKMTNHTWLNEDGSKFETDITKNWNGDKINYKKFFFKRNGKFYQTVNIKYKENNTYVRTIQEVTSDGNPVGEFIEGEPIVIDNNFKLWNFFGGKNSMELKNNKLVPSNTSVENVVIAMNNIGTIKSPTGSVYTQDDIWQALKMTDVHYVATAGAVKQGAANINSKSKYGSELDYSKDLEYDIQKIHMYQAGIQLDKEHHADESELSLMTQVISACAAKGYTFDDTVGLYNALRKSTDIKTRDHLNALLDLFTDGSEQSIRNFQEILMKSIVKSIATSRGETFVKNIALDLMEKAKSGKEISYSDAVIPLSDNTIYRKVFSTISSYLTNTGIKYKIPGLLSVLTPSYGIMKLYAGKKYESFNNPTEELAELQKQQVPVYDSRFTYTRDQKSFMGFNLAQVEYKSMKSEIDGQPVAARNMHNGNIYLDVQLLADKYIEKDWQKSRNSEPLNYDFKSPEEWINFVLLREAMHDQYLKKDGESSFDYETRINNEALKRLPNNITNLELGRTYIIERNETETIENIDTGEILEIPIEERKLISTPNEYKQLKKDIQDGKVISVTEDLTVGRNLAGYNVRFKTDKGSYQLWDLTSASTLFDLNELKKNWTGSQEDVNKLSEIIKDQYNGSPNIDINNAKSYLNAFIVRVRRALQNDLQNLSKTKDDVIQQYNNFLKSHNNTNEWCTKYAQWVNIKLGRNDGSKLKLDGELINVTPDNLKEVHSKVLKLLEKLNQVKIDGEQHTIDRNSISQNAYEIIMPKTFATKFGLSEFDDLNTIKNDEDYFIKQYIKNQSTKVEPNQYSIEFKKSDGNHIYVLNKKRVIDSQLTKLNGIVTYTDEEGKIYRLDSDNNIMYEITPDTEIYVDALGNQVIVSDDFDHYINELKYDSIKLSDGLRDKPALLIQICDSIKKSSNKFAKKFGNNLTSYGTSAQDILQYNREYHDITLDNYKLLPDDNYIIKSGKEKHTSFLRSLDIVAARIPAQSMQSYMPMKIVAYDNPDINTAYVSTYQILLQGSDYDIDAVSLATFDIDSNGKLQLWSKYADLTNDKMRQESEKLPMPSGIEININESEDINWSLDFFRKYGDLFEITPSYEYNKDLKQYVSDQNKVNVELKIDTPEKMERLGQMLRETKAIFKPDAQHIANFKENYPDINNNVKTNFNQFNDIFEKIKNIIDDHNLYLDNISKNKLSTIINNYTIMSMYNTIIDPVNLIEAQTSVDGTTGPLKDVAEKSSEGKEAKNRTPGNFVNKYQSIVENQVGKDAIAICATGLKSFFALTQYNNYILNHGTEEQQKRLLIGYSGAGKYIGGKRYNTLANIRPKNPTTILNEKVLQALSNVTNDNDAALTLSALLSLATDNAKELALSKLNAGTKTIGMYIYGISIGMDFKDIAKLLMSPTGNLVTSLLDGNSFRGEKETIQVADIFKYFSAFPKKELYKYNVYKDLEGNRINVNLINYFSNSFIEKIERDFVNIALDPRDKIENHIAEFAKSPAYTIQNKLECLERIRNEFTNTNKFAKTMFNQLIDSIEEYTVNLSSIDNITLDSIHELADGAKEMKRLGAILGLNQGIKTDPEGLLKQVNLISNAIFDQTENINDKIDIYQFAFDPQYRLEAIQKYEKYKHSFNILDVVSTIPHFMGYIRTLATAFKEASESFKFRSCVNLIPNLAKELKYKNEAKLMKGVENYVGDFLRDQWFSQSRKQVIIPEGNSYLTKNLTVGKLKKDLPVNLGDDIGAATFRMFMEQQIIPDLQLGKISPNAEVPGIKDNKFIKDLMNDISTNTVSGNASIIYTLPINMLPRTDSETAILDAYKSEFNKLARYTYSYKVKGFDSNGNPTTRIESIPIVDLFIYYAMIANNWKLSENSLVPILENFNDSGIIKEFHEFEKNYDRSGETLSMDNVDLINIIPYVAQKASPYSSYNKYIWHKNKTNHKYELMKRIDKGKNTYDDYDNYIDYDYYDVDQGNNNVIGDYEFLGSSATNYLQTGAEKNKMKIVDKILADPNISGYSIKFNDITYQINSITYRNQKNQEFNVKISELGITELPTKKINGIREIDFELLDDLIKSYTNPC